MMLTGPMFGSIIGYMVSIIAGDYSSIGPVISFLITPINVVNGFIRQ